MQFIRDMMGWASDDDIQMGYSSRLVTLLDTSSSTSYFSTSTLHLITVPDKKRNNLGDFVDTFPVNNYQI